MRDRRIVVDVYYATPDAASDAVSRVLEELSHCISIAGPQEMRIIEPPRVIRIVKGYWQVYQLLYILWASARMIFSTPRHQVVVTVDVPPGLACAASVVRLLKRGQVNHIAYILDLYHNVQTNNPSLKGSLLRGLARLDARAMRDADACVTIGECMRHRLVDVGVSAVVIPVWPIARRASFDEKLPDTGHEGLGRPYVFYGGHAGVRHPLGAVVEAAKLQPGVDFVFRGSGVEIDALRTRARAENLQNILFIGRLDESEFEGLARKASVHLVTLGEEFTGTCVPSKTYEAMSLGKPVIYMGDTSGQAAADVTAAECGLVIPHQGGDLASAVDIVLRGQREMGEFGRSFQMRYRTLEGAAREWQSLILRTIRQPMPLVNGEQNKRSLSG